MHEQDDRIPPHGEPPDSAGGGCERELEDQIAALAAQVRRLGERLAAGSSLPRLFGAWAHGNSEPVDPPAQPAAGSFDAGILASAESVASEIRATAEREARRIRDGAQREASMRAADLRAMVARQRETLAALGAEIGHLEHSIATIRSQSRALEAELRAVGQAIGESLP